MFSGEVTSTKSHYRIMLDRPTYTLVLREIYTPLNLGWLLKYCIKCPDWTMSGMSQQEDTL